MGRTYPELDEGKRKSDYDDRGRRRDVPVDRRDCRRYDREPDRTGPTRRGERRDRSAYISGYAGYEAPYPDYGRQPTPWDPDDLGAYEKGPLRSHLRCRDIMTRAVVTCRRDTPIRQIANIMREEDTGAVPVVSADTTLDGIVTDRDIVVRGLTSDKGDTELDAKDCMSTDIYSAHPNDRVVDVLDEMGDHQVRRIPIVDNRKRLVGIVSMADLAVEAGRDRELANALEKISKPASWLDRLANFFRWQ